MNTNITCGNCKGTHTTPEMVKACYVNGAAFLDTTDLLPCERKAIATGAVPFVPATDKQIKFLYSLATTKELVYGTNDECVANLDRMQASGGISKDIASGLIGVLVKLPKRTTTPAAAKQAVALEDGVYRDGNGIFWMVYHTVHGANQQVAKRLVVTTNTDGTFNGTWDYAGKAPLASLTPADKLSAEDAAQFGKVYGFCVRCARTLTKEESKHVGYGQTCAGHEGWPYPTKAEMKALVLSA